MISLTLPTALSVICTMSSFTPGLGALRLPIIQTGSNRPTFCLLAVTRWGSVGQNRAWVGQDAIRQADCQPAFFAHVRPPACQGDLRSVLSSLRGELRPPRASRVEARLCHCAILQIVVSAGT